MPYTESRALSVRLWLASQAVIAPSTPAASRSLATSLSSRRSTQRSTSAIVRSSRAAANRSGARSFWPRVFQYLCSAVPRVPRSAVWAMVAAICWAPAQVRQNASGVHRAPASPELPRGSRTTTSPRRSRWARVALMTSGLTEVARTGPVHSRMAGMTTPAVLKLPGGPKTRTEWQSSAASSRPNAPLVRPRITRPGWGWWIRSGRSSRGVAQVADPAAGRLARAPGAFGLPNPTRCQSRITPPVAPAAPAVVATKLAYIPAGPGRACWAAVGQASAGSSRWWRSCSTTRATSAGSSSSQV